ncbi:hypothetical protein DV736_g1925, partial [Chaetothyriales sp. CBS 134916]
MHFFTTLATFGLVALVSSQSVTDSSTSTPASNTESSAPASTSLSAEQKCIQACGTSDICCQAACVNVPCPSQLQANQTTECAAQCPQGNGSPDETSSYAACQASCISSLFFPSSGATGAAATGTAGSSGSAASASATATSGSGSSASSGSASSGATGSSHSGSGTASATGSAASSSSTSNNSGLSIKNQVAGVGLVGLIIAGLAFNVVPKIVLERLLDPQQQRTSYFSVDNERHLYEGFFDWLDDWIDECLLAIRAPRFRRLILGLSILVMGIIFLWVKVVGPWIAEERALWRSLNKDLSKSAGGLFGSNVRPHFAGMVFIRDMDSRYLPSESSPKKRLIFVGDIHGCKGELLALMDKVHFKPETDHLIAVGDVVNKGPDSPGVIDFLMANNASCVRGNHEDTLLLMANDVASSALRSHNGKSYHTGKPKDKDPLTKLILRLSQEQLNWLQSLPVVLKVGNIKGIGNIIVVHAGLVPGVPLDAQDPFSVMNMRTIDLMTHVPSKFHAQEGSVPWFRLWSRYQTILQGHLKWKSLVGKHTAHLDTPTFVVYGHDARMGLQIDTMDQLEMDILSMRQNMRANEGTIEALRKGRNAKALQPSLSLVGPSPHLRIPTGPWQSLSTEATSLGSAMESTRRTLAGELENAWSFSRDSSGWSSSLIGSKHSPSIQPFSRRDRYPDEKAGEHEAFNRLFKSTLHVSAHGRPTTEAVVNAMQHRSESAAKPTDDSKSSKTSIGWSGTTMMLHGGPTEEKRQGIEERDHLVAGPMPLSEHLQQEIHQQSGSASSASEADDRPAESIKNDRVKKIGREIAAAVPPASASERLVECLARVVMAIDEAQSERRNHGLSPFDFGLRAGPDGYVLIESGHKSKPQQSDASKQSNTETPRKALRLWLARVAASALQLAICLVVFTLINVLIAIKEELRCGNVSHVKRDEIMSWRSDLIGWDVIDWIRYRATIWLDANRELNV